MKMLSIARLRLSFFWLTMLSIRRLTSSHFTPFNSKEIMNTAKTHPILVNVRRNKRMVEMFERGTPVETLAERFGVVDVILGDADEDVGIDLGDGRTITPFGIVEMPAKEIAKDPDSMLRIRLASGQTIPEVAKVYNLPTYKDILIESHEGWQITGEARWDDESGVSDDIPISEEPVPDDQEDISSYVQQMAQEAADDATEYAISEAEEGDVLSPVTANVRLTVWGLDSDGDLAYVVVEASAEGDLPENAGEKDEEEGTWESPYDLLGGIEENPGVQGHGGGVIIREVSSATGRYRITNTWDQSHSAVPQTTICYEEADEESLRWISSL
jgi:hypothetical protein